MARALLMIGYQDYLERMNTHTYEIVDGESTPISRKG